MSVSKEHLWNHFNDVIINNTKTEQPDEMLDQYGGCWTKSLKN